MLIVTVLLRKWDLKKQSADNDYLCQRIVFLVSSYCLAVAFFREGEFVVFLEFGFEF